MIVDTWAHAHPLEPAIPRGALRPMVGIPADVLLDPLITEAGLSLVDGRVGRSRSAPSLGPAEAGLATVLARLVERPFDAPERDELRALGLGTREVAAAVRSGRLLQVADGVVLRTDAPQRAVEILTGLDPPFTLSAARQALGTTRRVAVPLLEHLDSLGVTQRVDGNTRRIQ